MGAIRFAVIGTSGITRWFLRGACEDPQFHLAVVCSRSMEKARAFAADYEGAEPCDSLDALAGRNDIDAVYIATPNSTHAAIAIRMMESGKSVLVEKPAAANAQQWRAMTEVAWRKGVTLMEAMLPTMSPNFTVVRDRLRGMGTIRRYTASYCQYSSRIDRLRRGDVTNVFMPSMGGGATMDIGVYTLYPMVALFGMPAEVKAMAGMLPTGVDGQAMVSMRYGEMMAQVTYSKVDDSSLPSEIAGDGGSLLLSSIHLLHEVKYVPHAAPSSGQGPAAEAEIIATKPAANDYYYETHEFISLLESGRKQSDINSWDNSLRTLELTDEIRRQTGVVFPADSANA